MAFRLAIWFVASQVAMFLSFTGTVDIKLGDTIVNTKEGSILVGRLGWKQVVHDRSIR